MFNASIFLFALFGSLTLWPSCRGGNAAVTLLPNPAADDRPAGSAPELPRVTVDLPPTALPAATRVLADGDDLQSAIDQAKPGDVIALQPGAVFKGPFTLPNKEGNGWITIRTNASTFPAAGTRVSPSDARLMPVIESDRDSAIMADAGAHHFRFAGIEIRPHDDIFLYNLISLGDNGTSVDTLPHHIVFERCYVHGDAKSGGRRGLAMNSRETAVIDSYFADFKEIGNDSQAIAAWNGDGPFAIINNYLEASGENVLFGGADPKIINLVPSDITIANNRLAKPASWKKQPANVLDYPWTVKNLFELKNARRVLVEHNIFENNWPDAQNGYAILFTPRNQDGDSPWSMVRDVTFRDNIVRHVSSGLTMQGTDDIHNSQQTKRIRISDNIFEDVSGENWGGLGNWIQITDGAQDVTVDHNTVFQTGSVLVASGLPNLGFTFTNNLAPNNKFGVAGDSHYGDPDGALKTYFPAYVFSKNVVQGGEASEYPAGNFFPSSMNDVGFVNYPGGDYRLESESPYKNAGTDGRDIGANIDGIVPPPSRHRAVGTH
jgi:hypothetical protein